MAHGIHLYREHASAPAASEARMANPGRLARLATTLAKMMFIIATYSATASPSAQSDERRFHAQGRLDWMWNGETSPKTIVLFDMKNDGCAWVLETRSGSSKLGGKRIQGSDGETLYSMEVIEAEGFGVPPGVDTNSLAWKEKMRRIKRGEDYQQAEVRERASPLGDPMGHHLAWLALSSSCFFHSLGSFNAILPADMFSYVEKGTNTVCRSTWSFDSTDSFLATLDVLGANHLKDAAGGVIMLKAPFNMPYTNFTFRVQETARLHGQVIPVSFRFTWYYPDYDGDNAGPLATPYYVAGIVTNLTRLDEPITGTPAVTRRLTVKDYRAEASFGIPYVKYYTANKWLNTNDAEWIRTAKGIKLASTKPNFLVYAFVSALILALAYAVVAYRSGLRKNHTT